MNYILKIISGMLLGLILLAFLFIYFCPLLNSYPKSTGKYCIGNQLLHFKDEENQYGLDKINEFNVDIFYPSNAIVPQRFLYRPQQIWAINNLAVASLADGCIVKKIFFNFLVHDAYPYVQPNATLNSKLPKFPIIIYLPGISSYDMHILYLSDLASHGYVVCAIEPPYDTQISVFPDNQHITLDRQLHKAQQEKNRDFIYQYRNKAHETWSKYIDITLCELQKLNNNPNSIWYQRLDLEQVGLLGHSHGGAVALDYCQKNSCCKAGINMDGWTKTYNSTTTFNIPFLMLIGQYGGIIDIPQVKKLIENNKRPDFQAKIIQDAYHESFSDGILTPWPWNYIFNSYVPNSKKTMLEISNSIFVFFATYLKSDSMG